MNKHIKKISNLTIVGGMSAMLIASLVGCGGDDNSTQQKEPETPKNNILKEGATVTIEEKPAGVYKIIDEIPSATTRVILRDANGTERILSQAEIDKLVKEEAARVDAGTSALTKPPEEVSSSGGLGLAGTLMASMAGAMVGSYLMNKLMNNQNYQANRRSSYSSPSVYSRSQSSFSKMRATGNSLKKTPTTNTKTTPTTSSSPRRSGFGASKSTRSSRSTFGG